MQLDGTAAATVLQQLDGTAVGSFLAADRWFSIDGTTTERWYCKLQYGLYCIIDGTIEDKWYWRISMYS